MSVALPEIFPSRNSPALHGIGCTELVAFSPTSYDLTRTSLINYSFIRVAHGNTVAFPWKEPIVALRGPVGASIIVRGVYFKRISQCVNCDYQLISRIGKLCGKQ